MAGMRSAPPRVFSHQLVCLSTIGLFALVFYFSLWLGWGNSTFASTPPSLFFKNPFIHLSAASPLLFLPVLDFYITFTSILYSTISVLIFSLINLLYRATFRIVEVKEGFLGRLLSPGH